MAHDGLAPLSTLGCEALAARVVFRARKQGTISYFTPVAGLPGFSRALARTLRELRLAGTSPEALASGSASARDLAVLLADYELELGERGLADLAAMLSMARDAVERADHPWAGLPVASLDVHLESQAHHDLFDALIRNAPNTMVAELGKPLGKVEKPKDVLAHLRANLFEGSADAFANVDGKFELFSAPGEGLEAVEISRRILRLAREGVNFDQVAILLRNPERYQPMVEDALRRAGFRHTSRGDRRGPIHRVVRSWRFSAAQRRICQRRDSRSTCHWARFRLLRSLSSGFRRRGDAPAEPAPETDRPAPRRWEQYLVDAAVIGRRDRWERRLSGLQAVGTERGGKRRASAQLRSLREFALPLVDALGALPREAAWKEWLGALGGLAQRALRSPEGVLATLAESRADGRCGSRDAGGSDRGSQRSVAVLAQRAGAASLGQGVRRVD